MFRLWCVLIGYAFGIIQLRKNKKHPAFLCILVDVFKVLLAIILTWFIFKNGYQDKIYVLKIYTGLGLMIGHTYPPYLKFKGGLDIATLGAFMCSFFWPIIPGQFIIFAGIFFLTHYVSLATIFAVIGFIIQIVFFGNAGFLPMEELPLLELYSVSIGLLIFILFKYRTNIWRLFHNEEPRTYLTKKKSNKIIVPVKKEELDIVTKEELNPEATPTVMPRKVKRKIKKEKSHFKEPVKVSREIVEESGPAFEEKEYKESRIQKKFIENRNEQLAEEINPIQISLAEHNAIEYKNIDELKPGVSTQIMATHQIDTLAIKETMEKLEIGGNTNE